MSLIKSEIKTLRVSYVETRPKVIKIPAFKIPVQNLKIAGVFFLVLCIAFVTSFTNPPTIEERNLEVPEITEVSEASVLPDIIKSVESIIKKEKTDQSVQIRRRALELLKEKWNPDTRTFKKRGGGFSKQDNTVTITKEDMLNYVPDFIVEEVVTKVPCLASITAAQADIEGNWWSSNLATKTNNNFGIKYVKKWDKDPETWMSQYREGHVVAHDDIPTDKFIKFKSKWACIRFHTKFLTLLHYKKHIGKDFKGWAKGLKDSGYATDKTYPDSLKDRYKRLDLQTVESIAYQLRQEYK